MSGSFRILEKKECWHKCKFNVLLKYVNTCRRKQLKKGLEKEKTLKRKGKSGKFVGFTANLCPAISFLALPLTVDGVWKTYITAKGSTSYAVHCCSPAGGEPPYYASQWEHHRKVSVTRLWHLQQEASKTLCFCFYTFPFTFGSF